MTKALYDGAVKVSGLRWRPQGETIELPISALCANILCVGHNNALSPVDAEALRFRDAIAEAVDSAWDPSKWGTHPKYTAIDGDRLVRWFCKTICNLETLQGKALSPGLVQRAFAIGGRGTVAVYMHKNYSPPTDGDYSHFQYCSWDHHLRGQEAQLHILRFGIYEWLVSPFHLTQDECNAFGKATGLNHWFRAKPLVETLRLPIRPGSPPCTIKAAHWINLRFPRRKRRKR